MSIPKVCIIVPVYNVEKYLERCLNSIKNQTSNDWEAILVNDGSTDGSLSLMQQLCENDDRFRIIDKKNGGAASARNAGIDAARTKYITFVDADDSIKEHYVEKMLDKIEQYQCDWVISGQRVKDYDRNLPNSGLQEFEPSLFFKYADAGPIAKLFKKEILDRQNIRFFEDMKVAEDYVFVAMYAMFVKSYYVISEVFYIYYLDNDTSLMHRYWGNKLSVEDYCHKIEAPWRVYQRALDCIDCQEKNRSRFIYEMYRSMWTIYFDVIKYVPLGYRKTISKHFKSRLRDFSKDVSILQRITLTQRYPNLRLIVGRIKSYLKKSSKKQIGQSGAV